MGWFGVCIVSALWSDCWLVCLVWWGVALCFIRLFYEFGLGLNVFIGWAVIDDYWYGVDDCLLIVLLYILMWSLRRVVCLLFIRICFDYYLEVLRFCYMV